METRTVIEGYVENVIYKNENNGYAVFELSASGGNDENAKGGAKDSADNNKDKAYDNTICVGFLHGLNEGETVKLTGEFINHPTYGRQFSVTLYEKNMPTTTEGIERYLASGAIKGIGEKLAVRIVEKFGDNTLVIIEDYPERLAEISGITPQKAKQISEIFHTQKEQRQMLIFLQQYGISLAYGMKIYKKYGAGTAEVLKRNPYALCDDVFGIGFKTADGIARKLGIKPDSPHRVRSAVKYVLNEASSNGHIYLPKDELLQNASDFLEIDSQIIEDCLQAMQIEKEIHQEKDMEDIRVYLNFFYYAEIFIARKLMALSRGFHANGADFAKNEIDLEKPDGICAKDADISQNTADFEEPDGIKLAENQKTAVYEALTNGVFVMTGGPGTGKTTTVNAIIRILKKQGVNIGLAAPTGRAAKRLSLATGREAKTIHRLLEVSFGDGDSRLFTFERNEDNPLELDVLIIDECSMMDISLTYHLLKALPDTAKLILVGDADQLPSVGAGNVLKDIIASGKLKVVSLNKIFRQAAESAIVMNAHRINAGQYPLFNEKDKDFFFIKRENASECVAEVMELAVKRLPAYLKTNGLFDIQVLSPMRKSETGIYNLNEKLQAALNPPRKNKKEKFHRGTVFREGDKVMQIKNNYGLSWEAYDDAGNITDDGQGVYNGDFGFIKTIDNENETLTILFDDNKRATYDFALLEELELAYAVTIHKSQGSEYTAVIIPLIGGPPMLMSRNLLYTAVTRAKKLAVIVGIPRTLYRMVDNNREVNRCTTLKKRIEFLWNETG